MLQGFEHVGITSSDLDQSLEFYCGLLGLKKVLVKPTSDRGRIAFLDACGVMLEIFEPPAPVQTPARKAPLSEVGIRHITFRVDDVEMEFGRL
jgi:glyoxylase I family protein